MKERKKVEGGLIAMEVNIVDIVAVAVVTTKELTINDITILADPGNSSIKKFKLLQLATIIKSI